VRYLASLFMVCIILGPVFTMLLIGLHYIAAAGKMPFWLVYGVAITLGAIIQMEATNNSRRM
jgi:hypothetical protein